MRLSIILVLSISLAGYKLSSLSVHQKDGKLALSLTSEECLKLNINANPADNVNYVGGMDADGNPVAPADLSSGIQIQTPRFISVPIKVHLEQFLGVQNPILNEFARKAEAGDVTVDLKNNQAFYNGQPLFNVSTELLESACQGKMKSSISTDSDSKLGE